MKETLVNLHRFPNAVGSEQTDVPVYFLHIPKTAGSTLSRFLGSLFLDSEFWHRGGDRNWENLLKLTPEELRRCQIINGHFAGYLSRHYALPLRYLTFVRDPLARALSHHEHVLRNKPHYFHKLARKLGTFGAYLRDERTQPTVANFQLRCVGATFDPVELAKTLTAEQIARRELERRLDTMPLTRPIEELLQTAQARLDQMCFVGLTERFEESLGLLCETFSWSRPATIEMHNVNPRAMSVKDLPSADIRLLKRLNEADIELYQLAKARFERDWARSRFVYPQLHAFVSYAQNAEDVLLHRALRNVDQGTYVDVGANDPSGDSVTKAFYDRGWRGINIEPVTSLYEALVKQRPDDVNIQAAAGAADAKKTLYEIPGTGLSTLDASIADRHRSQGFKVTETRVRVRTLRSILAETLRPDIHFLKIDVEGWEREALQGIDLSVTRPWIVVVEATEPNSEVPSYREWEPLLLRHGYSFVFFDGLNRYYLARERRKLKKAFSRPVNSGDVFIKFSEASAVRAMRDAQWSLRKQSVLLREHEVSLAEFNRWAQSLEASVKVLEQDQDALRQEVAVQVDARGVEREEANRQIEALTLWATSADAYGKSLVSECEGLRVSLKDANDAREAERAEAIRQVEALTQWATSADVYGKSLVGECEGLRVALKNANEVRETERVETIRQVEALTERATSADAYGKSLVGECEGLRVALKAANEGRETERVETIRQVEALTERATSADAYGESLVDECDGLRASLKAANEVQETERVETIRQVEALTERATSADAYGKSLVDERERLRASLKAANDAHETERVETIRQVAALTERATSADAFGATLATEVMRWREKWQQEVDARSEDQESSRQKIQELTASAISAGDFANALLGERAQIQEILKEEREARALEQGDTKERAEHLKAGIATLERELADNLAMEAKLNLALQREQTERREANLAWSGERNTLEAGAQVLAEYLQRAEEDVSALGTQLDALKENQARSKAEWHAERNDLETSLIALEGRLTELHRHWAVRLLVDKQYMSRTPARSTERIPKRKIGIFTIASKNYLAYVRVLLKSVAAIHPEYALYLCLADKVDGAFDPRAEVFQVVQSDGIGIPHFDDMTVRYDIMEFNTAIKPFMFQWLLDNTDLDSVIYLDPDIRAFSRFNRLEAVLASDVSVVLTPHITRPVEDGKNPNDYHMLQAGIFNLGFAAINRCNEARRFVEWWGRRLETQADADFSRNLFTDQRWCDLAPCFLDRLHVLKEPGYNVAYWNLAEQTVRQVRGEWRANGQPLTFFHFSGVNASKENVISKHQNRFDWKDVPTCKPMFDAYRQALLQEGWEQSKGWEYAYANTKEGLRVPPVVRQLYRLSFCTSQTFVGTCVTDKLLGLCNGNSNTVPFDFASPITRLMDIIYRQRQDLQAVYNLETYEGRAGFRAWYASAASREYNLPSEFVPHISPLEAEAPPSAGSGMTDNDIRATAARPLTVFGGGAATQVSTARRVEDALDVRGTWEKLPVAVRRLLAPAVHRMLAAVTANDVLESAAPDQSTEESNFKPPVTGRIDALQGTAPLPQFLGDHRYISVLMHMIWFSRSDLRVAFDLDTPEGQIAFAGWFDASARREYGLDTRVPIRPELDNSEKDAPLKLTMTCSRPGANLIGYAHAELGMGEHVRMSAAALESTTVQFGVVNFNVGVASRQGARLEHGEVVPGNPFAANVFHINADQMLVAYCHLGREFFTNKYNIAYWAWELAKCPAEWLPVLKMVDEVWAPSRFVQQAFAESADIPVEYMPLCVTLPEFNRLDRRHFDLPDRAFVFLYTFDFFSFLDRKNPFAAIRAFKRAFPERRSDVCLVLKVMNGKDESPLWVNMTQLIDGDPRIVIINRTLNRSEVLALFDTSDCFLSLHRSEGFGRGPAEAMYLGKPVIVTNYSGNTDFTLADNSCLVDFTLIQVEEGQYPFHQGQQWADADVEHAAWYMKKLYADSAYARDLGERGRTYIRENFSQRTIGAIYESRLKTLGLA